MVISVGYEGLTYHVVQQKSAYDVEDFIGKFAEYNANARSFYKSYLFNYIYVICCKCQFK